MNHYKAVRIKGVKYDEHRLLMETRLGRKLDTDEIVHHIDGNKHNNDINNLQIMSRAEHARLHQTGRKASEETLKKMSMVSMGNRNGPPRKLTPDQVLYVREKYIPRDPEFGTRALARRFGVNHTKIIKIINRQTYKDIP